jgi:hypothetical protein
MEKPWKVIAAFILVFIAGAVFGGVFTVGFSARRSPGATKTSPPAKAPVASGAATPAKPKAEGQGAGVLARTNSLTPAVLRQFAQRLELSAEQKERIGPIVSRASEDLVRLRQENLVDTARVTERMYTDVAAALTPTQRTELATMTRQMEERVMAERRKRAEAAAAEAPRATVTPPAPAKPVSP